MNSTFKNRLVACALASAALATQGDVCSDADADEEEYTPGMFWFQPHSFIVEDRITNVVARVVGTNDVEVSFEMDMPHGGVCAVWTIAERESVRVMLEASLFSAGACELVWSDPESDAVRLRFVVPNAARKTIWLSNGIKRRKIYEGEESSYESDLCPGGLGSLTSPNIFSSVWDDSRDVRTFGPYGESGVSSYGFYLVSDDPSSGWIERQMIPFLRGEYGDRIAFQVNHFDKESLAWVFLEFLSNGATNGKREYMSTGEGLAPTAIPDDCIRRIMRGMESGGKNAPLDAAEIAPVGHPPKDESAYKR